MQEPVCGSLGPCMARPSASSWLHVWVLARPRWHLVCPAGLLEHASSAAHCCWPGQNEFGQQVPGRHGHSWLRSRNEALAQRQILR